MRGYWVSFSILLLHTPVAQLEEAAVSKTVNVRVQILPSRPFALVTELADVLASETRFCEGNVMDLLFVVKLVDQTQSD